MADPGTIGDFLKEQAVIVLDGGLASELERLGADLKDPLWSGRTFLETPDLVGQVHQAYLLAGADVITTVSYQLSFDGLMSQGFSATEAERVLTSSVAVAVKERDKFWSDPANRKGRFRPLVAASIGPYGAFLADGSEFTGEYGISNSRLRDFHRPQIELLAESGADLLAFETIPSIAEAQIMVQILSEAAQTPAWLSYSCSDGRTTSAGDSFGAAVSLASQADQIAAVGLNCTDPRHAQSLLQLAQETTEKPLVCYPNAGGVWDSDKREWQQSGAPVEFERSCADWVKAGARLIGGCCRTTPDDIRLIAKALRSPKS